jgi:nucleoid-associated protein YgaU
MSRYATSRVIANTKEKRYVSSTIVPVMPLSVDDTYIVTTSVERLDKLANTFYGDATKWWVIATANGLGKGTVLVPADSRLRIPSISNVQQVINNLNNLR